MAQNWPDLLPELLELCSRRLLLRDWIGMQLLELCSRRLLLRDWFAFRSVCSTCARRGVLPHSKRGSTTQGGCSRTMRTPRQSGLSFNAGSEGQEIMVFLDVIHYQGQFVALGYQAVIFTSDVDGPYPTTQVILETPESPEFRDSINFAINEYLVESAGRLLLILRFEEREQKQRFEQREQKHGTVSFQVFVADLDTRKWTELESMGNVSLFVGFNSSFSIQVDENQQVIKPNCIYFTCWGDIGIYHMEDGRIEFDTKADYNFDPPLWIESPPLWIEPRF
ncbi:hypothetical protein EUGRSUZ_H00547 [Eucalyptus grandis]|uniref:Uncharacterized protein n=2 Tax=Eucalyptus grandis TaxID=71139 RepID=A0ACC3JN50_EUCGR|nr:hypothetical protein EUGRSUZ_H00547 [Eucalyptus grandis]